MGKVWSVYSQNVISQYGGGCLFVVNCPLLYILSILDCDVWHTLNFQHTFATIMLSDIKRMTQLNEKKRWQYAVKHIKRQQHCFLWKEVWLCICAIWSFLFFIYIAVGTYFSKVIIFFCKTLLIRKNYCNVKINNWKMTKYIFNKVLIYILHAWRDTAKHSKIHCIFFNKISKGINAANC